MKTAAEIMTKAPYTVTPDTSARDLARVLMEKNYSGAPALDADGKLVGVVTQSDLIYQKKKLHLPTVFTLFDAIIPLGGLREVDHQMDKILGQKVADIMSTDLVTVTEETHLDEIATIMTEKHKHLLPVLRGEKLVGVIDRWDMLRAIAGE